MSPQQQQQSATDAAAANAQPQKTMLLLGLSFALGVSVSCVAAELLPGSLAELFDSSSGEKKQDGATTLATKSRVQQYWEKMHAGKAFPQLTPRESDLVSEVVLPDDITARFKNIGGMKHILKDVMSHLLLPMRFPELFYVKNDTLGVSRPSRGILLWGPPGTGKTMIAKAVAKESNSVFINVTVSTVENKWFGETGKILAALFQLASKLAPSVVFLDEIDGMMRSRSESDAAHHSSLKTQLLSLLDGITTSDRPVTFIGATNRADHLDAAILRRLRRQIEVRLPDEDDRADILAKMIGGADSKPSSDAGDRIDFREIARATEGFSGSDINEVCRTANMIRFVDHCATVGIDVEEAACSAVTPDREKAFRTKMDSRPLAGLSQSCLMRAVESVKECTAPRKDSSAPPDP